MDRVVGLDGVRADIAMMQTPDGHARLEMARFHTPSTQGGVRHAGANNPGILHVAFVVEDVDASVAGLRALGAELVGQLERYEDSYRPCFVRGPEGSSSSWRRRSVEGPVGRVDQVIRASARKATSRSASVPSGSSVGLKIVSSRPRARPVAMAVRTIVVSSSQLSPSGLR